MAIDSNIIRSEQNINGISEKPDGNFQHICEPVRRIVERTVGAILDDGDTARLYAAYRDSRAAYRPEACTSGPCCWVENGPPCYSKQLKHPGGTAGGCVECLSPPRDVRLVARAER